MVFIKKIGTVDIGKKRLENENEGRHRAHINALMHIIMHKFLQILKYRAVLNLLEFLKSTTKNTQHNTTHNTKDTTKIKSFI